MPGSPPCNPRAAPFSDRHPGRPGLTCTAWRALLAGRAATMGLAAHARAKVVCMFVNSLSEPGRGWSSTEGWRARRWAGQKQIATYPGGKALGNFPLGADLKAALSVFFYILS